MKPHAQSLKRYSTEELRLLAAEGRLKGSRIDSLLRHETAELNDPVVPAVAIQRRARRHNCWTDPAALLDTFIELVRTPSPSGDESAVADLLDARLAHLGFEERRRDPMGNILATLPASDPNAASLLFTAHMDCVYPGGRTNVEPQFHRSGAVRSSGSTSLGADDKAGIAAILATLEYIVAGDLGHGEIRVVFTVQEERGYRGIKQVPASILNGVHLVVSMDPPVRVERNETARMAVLHTPPAHPYVYLAQQAAADCGFVPLLLFAEDGYVGGDTICLSPLGALVIDFCACSRMPHTVREHLHVTDLLDQTSWMMATVERVLGFDPANLELRAVYGAEPIGNLTGVRKQVPVAADFLQSKIDLARSLYDRPGPEVVPALGHLAAVAPRAGDRELLQEVVTAYARCLRTDQIPRVLRDLTGSLLHLASNLADVRPIEPLIPVVQQVLHHGGDDGAHINALRFIEELYHKERRAPARARILRILILCLQSDSEALVQAAREFFKANLDPTVHALTVAFCNRNRAGWERTLTGPRIVVGGVRRARQAKRTGEGVRWALLRQRILQLLLEEDRLLPEMLEWIFRHDGAATQRIAVGFIRPDGGGQVAAQILKNLHSRERGVQETAVHFVGTHRMVEAVGPLVDLLLAPHLCRNRGIVEWALMAIGAPALDDVVRRLSADRDTLPFVRRMFNLHDTTTEADFERLGARLDSAFEGHCRLDDPSQLALLGCYLGRGELDSTDTLSRWDRRRAVVFYEHLLRLYPSRRDFERFTEFVEEAEPAARGHVIQMAVQKNVFEDPEFLTLVSRENTRFLQHFVGLEQQVPRHVVLARLREFMSGAPLDMADHQDIELYYLFLLKQSPRMPGRTRYHRHIQEARRHLFPKPRPYARAFTISGDRIEEVGTVDRERIRRLIESLPTTDTRRDRLRAVLSAPGLARRERNRLLNSLAEAFAIDLSPLTSIDDRVDAVCGAIDFEFDASYRSVPEVVYPILFRIRMKHRADEVVAAMAGYALEYALLEHPELGEIFQSGELDLMLDNLNDLLTDRAFDAERDLSEDVFEDLRRKHVDALSRFYTQQWKYVVRELKKQFPEGRQAQLIAATEQAMSETIVEEEEHADQLDTNLERLVITLNTGNEDLIAFQRRHREFYRVYAAVLRSRNIRQLKRIYHEVHRTLQDRISYSAREHAPAAPSTRPRLATGAPEGEQPEARRPEHPGYLRYARKELGRLSKLMSDFVLERALESRVDIVRGEITKLRQIVVGTSQILCVPCKDVSIVFRSWPGNDCNTGDIRQALCPDCTFYKIIADGTWKGYFTLVELRRRGEKALLLDVINYSGLHMENESFIKVLMHHIIQTAKAEGMRYVLSSNSEAHLSNRDYIRRAIRKVFPPGGLVQGFSLAATPTAPFQSLGPNLSVIWDAQSHVG